MLLPIDRLPMAKVTGIIHVGGHEAEELHPYLLSGVKRILWIEANPEKSSLIQKKISRFPEMSVGNFAAGNDNCRMQLNISNNKQSSSILDLGTHQDFHPDIFYTNKVEVDMKRIDDYISTNHINRSQYNFMNLDIQGYELMALKGATNQLSYVDFIVSEVSETELYSGGATIDDIDEFLGFFGFVRLLTSMTQHRWGDAFYFKVSN